MPVYTYKDENHHMVSVVHPMEYSDPMICTTCGAEMWKVPQHVNVTWGGLAPSQGEYSPELKQHFDTLDRQRDEYAAEHEKHERRTELENGKT